MDKAMVVAAPSSRSPGSARNPMMVMMGNTSHPVSRSMTTEANESAALPLSWARRDTRTTSPPMVVGSTLDTN